jgi:hypothetical protein
VPWQLLSQDVNHEYVDFDCLFDGMLLREPTKIQQEDLKRIWKHWIDRQNANSQGLIFLQAKKGDMGEDTHAPNPQGGRRQDEDGEDFFKEGPSEVPHPSSPAANAMSLASKMEFLRTLSTDMIYAKFVDLLKSRESVSILFGAM